ncbi:transcriptional regulator PpsR [Jannaschia sp. Os4]|nr:transcriptional regulator PpsR [Jannaschia sp. Os4]
MSTRESDFWNERAGPRIAPQYFGDILTTAADIALVVGEGGTIISATTNPLNGAVGKVDHWEGRNLREFVAEDSIDKLDDRIRAAAGGETVHAPVEVNHRDNAAWTFPIRYTAHPTGVEGRVLLLGRDLRPVAELQQRLVRAQMALERDYEAQRDFQTRYRVVMEAASDPLVLVEVSSGRVLDANPAAAALLGSAPDALSGSAFAQEFEGRRKAEFLDALCGTAAANAETRDVAVETRRTGRALSLRARLFRAGGERLLLVALAGPGAVPSGDDPRAGLLGALFDRAGDAIVLTDRAGRIESANEAFLSMCDAGTVGDVAGRTLGEFLARGAVDMRILLDDASGPQRGYLTRVTGGYGTQVPVEISAARLDAPGVDGHGMILRDTARGAVAQAEAPAAEIVGATVGERAMREVMDQVGSSSLKEIVAATTDVIEKACIETALELTSDNRVAAAEMLGLSRQSLYVKLRKYGILSRDG